MKKLIGILAISIATVCIVATSIDKEPIPMETPMGHEMEYVQHIHEYLYEYRDTYTGVHYFVSVIDGEGSILRPVYISEDRELRVTE